MTKKSLVLFPLILFCLVFQSCKKDTANNVSASNSTDASTASSIIGSGTWNITSYTQKTESKSSNFSGLDFTFSKDGKVVVTGSKSANGTWSYSPSTPGYYGGPASLATFTINIVSDATFVKLSRSWNVGAISGTSLKLDNPEPLEDEHVTFTKK